ncbi:MAG: DUF1778 domain-containing protein [Hyphomonadaceae bacterium]
MPRPVKDDSQRMALRPRAADKARLVRAAALKQTDLTKFVMRAALEAADEVIAAAERVALSERDTQRMMTLLDNPPEPNARLLSAAKALPPRAVRLKRGRGEVEPA